MRIRCTCLSGCAARSCKNVALVNVVSGTGIAYSGGAGGKEIVSCAMGRPSKITLLAKREPVAPLTHPGQKELVQDKLRDLARNKKLMAVLTEILGDGRKTVTLADHVLTVSLRGFENQIKSLLEKAEKTLGERLIIKEPPKNDFRNTEKADPAERAAS